MKCKKNIILSFFLFVIVSIDAQTVIIEITDIKNAKGKIIISVFKDNDSFRKDEPFFDKCYDKTNLKEDKMKISINLNMGTYGVVILDDENCNYKMEYNIIGIPKEGYGFSNFYHKGIIRPHFKDFSFTVGEKGEIVQVRMKY